MNCANCGAPMKLVEGRGYFRCDFCATLSFPEPRAASPDGVVPLGERTDTDCPVCKTRLSQGRLEGFSVLYCESCRGVLADGEEFAAIVRVCRAKRREPPDQPVPLNPEELKRQVPCPLCQGEMDVHPYGGPGNVVIDSCARCRIVWLDHGEIGVIQRAPGRR